MKKVWGKFLVGLFFCVGIAGYGGLGSVSLAQAATLNVPLEYSTIQSAIDAANTGDTMMVHDGTYVENIDFLGVCRTLAAEYGIMVGNKSLP